MTSGMIKQDIDGFQASVKKLSEKIGNAGSLWTDPKFAELSHAVGLIANMSRDVILAGDKCQASIERFEKISSEKI